MERLRQHPLVLYPCVPPGHLTLSVYKEPFQVFFCDMAMAQEYFLGEQTVPLCADTQYAGILGMATPMRVTFERPVSVLYLYLLFFTAIH